LKETVEDNRYGSRIGKGETRQLKEGCLVKVPEPFLKYCKIAETRLSQKQWVPIPPRQMKNFLFNPSEKECQEPEEK
jgi:hypothetical protein